MLYVIALIVLALCIIITFLVGFTSNKTEHAMMIKDVEVRLNQQRL